MYAPNITVEPLSRESTHDAAGHREGKDYREGEHPVPRRHMPRNPQGIQQAVQQGNGPG